MKLQSNVWKAYVFNFLIGLHFIGGVLVPFFTDWGEISFAQAMALQAWFTAWVFLLEVPTGAVADKMGRKTSIIAGSAVCAIGFIVYTLHPHFVLFLLGELLLAAGIALVSGADEALVYDTLKEAGREKDSKKVLGRMNGFHIAGITVAAPIGSLIARFLGLRWTMMLIAVPCLLAMALAFTLKEPEAGGKNDKKGYFRTAIDGIKCFMSRPAVRALAVNGAILSVLCFFIIWTYQVLLAQLGVDILLFGIIHAAIAGIQVLIMNNYEGIERLAGGKGRYVLLSALIPAAAFIFLGINGNVVLAIIGIMVISALGLTRFVLISNYIQKHVDSENRATALSTASMLKRFCWMGGSLVLGLVVEWSLSWTLIGIGVLIAVLALTLRIKEEYLKD